MKFENRKLIRIIIVGALVGGLSGFLSYEIEKGFKSATNT